MSVRGEGMEHLERTLTEMSRGMTYPSTPDFTQAVLTHVASVWEQDVDTATGTPKKWTMDADYLQACNCDYGCPCEFGAHPTEGYCEGIGAWRINQGSYGDVSLDGLGLGYGLRCPGPMHEGNFTLTLFIDEKADQRQREALFEIASGRAGGRPFQIISTLVTTWIGPYFVPFEFNIEGRDSTARIGNMATIGLESIKNPITGQSESVRLEHETGFLFKGADVVSARACHISVEGMSFSWPNKAGFVAQVSYSS